MISPQRRSALYLAVVPLAALAVSAILAFASALPQRPPANGYGVLRTIAERRSQAQALDTRAGARSVAPTPAPPTSSPLPSSVDEPPLLWTLLTPWALAVDALAILGMAAVLALRHGTLPRGG